MHRVLCFKFGCDIQISDACVGNIKLQLHILSQFGASCTIYLIAFGIVLFKFWCCSSVFFDVFLVYSLEASLLL